MIELYNTFMNKIEMAQKLLRKFDIDLFENDCRMVDIPGNYTKLIKEIFTNNKLDIKFNFINKNDKEYIETNFHDIVKSGAGNTMRYVHSGLSLVNLINFKYNEKEMRTQGWYIPGIKYKTLENYLWNNPKWYLDKKNNKSFRNRMYTATILFLSNNLETMDYSSNNIQKFHNSFSKITSNKKSNYHGMFESIYSGVFNANIPYSQNSKAKKNSFGYVNSKDLNELKKSYESIFKISKEISLNILVHHKYIKEIKNINKYRKIFRNSLIHMSGSKNMNYLISDFQYLEAAHLVSVKESIKDNDLKAIMNPLNGLLIDPNLHKIIDNSGNKGKKPSLNIKTGIIELQNKVIAKIHISHLIPRILFIKKSKKFHIINE